MADSANGFGDIVSGPAEVHLGRGGVVGRPGGAFVVAARQTHAADVDDRLGAEVTTMESVLRDGYFVDLSLLADGLDMLMPSEADRGGLSGKCGSKARRVRR